MTAPVDPRHARIVAAAHHGTALTALPLPRSSSPSAFRHLTLPALLALPAIIDTRRRRHHVPAGQPDVHGGGADPAGAAAQRGGQRGAVADRDPRITRRTRGRLSLDLGGPRNRLPAPAPDSTCRARRSRRRMSAAILAAESVTFAFARRVRAAPPVTSPARPATAPAASAPTESPQQHAAPDHRRPGRAAPPGVTVGVVRRGAPGLGGLASCIQRHRHADRLSPGQGGHRAVPQ